MRTSWETGRRSWASSCSSRMGAVLRLNIHLHSIVHLERTTLFMVQTCGFTKLHYVYRQHTKTACQYQISQLYPNIRGGKSHERTPLNLIPRSSVVSFSLNHSTAFKSWHACCSSLRSSPFHVYCEYFHH